MRREREKVMEIIKLIALIIYAISAVLATFAPSQDLRFKHFMSSIYSAICYFMLNG